MLRMAQVQYIKDLYENEEKSLREISRITGHSFETVQKYAQKENWSEDNLPDTEPTSYPVLGKFIPIVDSWLEADRKVPRKQRHTAWRLFCRLRDEYGFTGSYSSVKRYVRKKKYVMKVQSAGFLPLERIFFSIRKNKARNSSSVFFVLVTAFRLSLMLSASTVPLKGGFARQMVNLSLIGFCLETLSL